MKYFTLIIACLFLFLTEINFCNAGDLGSLHFADDLMAKGEYYRAITEYYRFNTYNPNDGRVVSNNFKIAQCMELSGRTDEAMQEYNYIVEKHPKFRITALQKLSEIQSKNSKYEDSNETIRELELVDKVNNDTISLTKGINYINLQNYQAARDTFTTVKDHNSYNSPMAGKYLNIMDKGLPLKKKNKLLGGILGTILPGGGYLYADRPQTALAALLVIGGFGYTTYESFDKGLYGLGGVFAFATTGFYVGSIYGTVQAIGKYNNDKRIAFTKEFKF